MLHRFDLVGFGSGIYHSKHHRSVFNLAESLPMVEDKHAFIFSTCGAPAFGVDGGHVDDYVVKAHGSLKGILEGKGYRILDEFICPGWNTNKFLRFFGGINKGRSNEMDCQNARVFAEKLKTMIRSFDLIAFSSLHTAFSI